MSYPRGTTLDVMEATKMRRKSYTSEFKLEVVAFYRNNNLYQDRCPLCMRRLININDNEIWEYVLNIVHVYPGLKRH